MTIIMPIRTESLANRREHWAVKAKRAKHQRKTAYLLMPMVHAPCTITLTRIAPKKLDSDNLAISFKHVRDGIADRLGIDDGSDKLKWEYGQQSVGAGIYAVRVETKGG